MSWRNNSLAARREKMNITTLSMSEEVEFNESNNNYYINLLEKFNCVTETLRLTNKRNIFLLKEKCLFVRDGNNTIIILAFSGSIGNIEHSLYDELRLLIKGKDDKTIKKNNYIAGSWANSKNYESSDKEDYSYLTEKDDFS